MLDHNPVDCRGLRAQEPGDAAPACNRYLPFSTVGQMGATPYLFRSGFNAGIAFGEDIRPKDYPRNLLKQAIAEGKRIRKYYFGDFYPLSPVTMSARDWCVMQYHLPGEQDGMIVAFRRPESPDAVLNLAVREIDPSAKYMVTQSRDYTPSNPVSMKGSELKTLKVQIDERPGSVIVEYRRVTTR